MAMLRMHLTARVPKLGETRPGIEVRPELQAVVERAMAKVPADRFANAGEMLTALDAVPSPGACKPGAPAARVQPMSYANVQASKAGVGTLTALLIGAVLLGVAVVALAAAFLLFLA